MRLSLCIGFAAFAACAQTDFADSVKPPLVQNCQPCHSAAKTRGPAPFLQASSAADVDANRGLWRNVAAQLRNRTMPPRDSKLSEEDRLHIASWIEKRLDQTACSVPEYAGAAVTRRLNRREYHHTVRDLLGLDFEVQGLLPADGTGGAGFDTNGETLYIPPVLTERYMEAAQQILDRVIITPPLAKTFTTSEASVNIYNEGAYDVLVSVQSPDDTPRLTLELDGTEAGVLNVQRRRIIAGKPQPGPLNARLQLNLNRGSHTLTVNPGQSGATIVRMSIQARMDPPLPEKRALHYRLFGMEAGERPLQPRKAAAKILQTFLPAAFRRPVQQSEIDRFLAFYDRAAERGDPYEERVKLALKAVLVWPEFLFRIEQKQREPGIHPLGQYELATRLSYFLWSTAPDSALLHLADQGRLQDPAVLTAQVDRMLDDTRSRTFISSFTGQWLGTHDIGGRVVPLLTELQSYYTPDVAADLRAQPVLLLDRILGENRSLLDLLTADYTHLTQRLAKFYQIEDKVEGLSDDEFRLVQWPDSRRAGVLGLGGVLAMTSRYKETSPVLRGAWVLDTLLGTPVPPPPPDVPPLDADNETAVKLSMREKLEHHRNNPSCSACHRLMDPIGLGLENFDWMGRWRDAEASGERVNATGALPSGEKFDGPVELRTVLLNRKEEFVRNLVARVLGYALGRSLQDGDSCTVQRIVQALEKDDYRARTLIREVVLSTPFRNTQGGAVAVDPLVTQRSVNISELNARKQDAASHNNLVKPAKPKP